MVRGVVSWSATKLLNDRTVPRRLADSTPIIPSILLYWLSGEVLTVPYLGGGDCLAEPGKDV